jgi:hypothetical protein
METAAAEKTGGNSREHEVRARNRTRGEHFDLQPLSIELPRFFLSFLLQLLLPMFRSASKLRAAEAGALRSLAHAKASPSFCCARRTPLLLTTRHTALKTDSLFQRRPFSATTSMANTRTESDAFGEIQVPADKYWGAQTERSLENFRINQPQDRMPPPIVRAFGILKGAAATVNMKFGLGMAVCPNTKPRC